MGSRQHVSWGAMAAGPAHSLGEWLDFWQLTVEVQGARLARMRGSAVMISDIEEVIPEAWMGAFTRFEVLLAVRGCSEDCQLFFEIGACGRMQRVMQETELVLQCTFQRVRVVEHLDRQWHVDPDPDDVQSDPNWRLWAWEQRPLARLQWDPGEWQWRDPFASLDSPAIPFFQYTARLGRHILTGRRGAIPAAAEH